MSTSQPSFEDTNAQLIHAIHHVTKYELNFILIKMCKESPECLLQANKFFLVSSDAPSTIQISSSSESDSDDGAEDQRRKRPRLDGSSPSNPREVSPPITRSMSTQARGQDSLAPAQASTPPRMVSRFEKCRVCHESFDVTDNDDEACITHTGKRETQQGWYDDFDHIEGDPDPEPDPNDDHDWRVEEWPRYFLWECCGKPADNEGCRVQKHQR